MLVLLLAMLFALLLLLPTEERELVVVNEDGATEAAAAAAEAEGADPHRAARASNAWVFIMVVWFMREEKVYSLWLWCFVLIFNRDCSRPTVANIYDEREIEE